MYDILQLNDMLLPELQDIAEQLSLPGIKKLDKQGLIYKILDGQAVKASESKDEPKKKSGRPRKPITIKTSTANGTEEAEVMESEEATEAPDPVEKAAPVATGKPRPNPRPVGRPPVGPATPVAPVEPCGPVAPVKPEVTIAKITWWLFGKVYVEVTRVTGRLT